MDVGGDGKRAAASAPWAHYAQRKQFWKSFHEALGVEQMDEDPDYAFDPVPQKKDFEFRGKNVFLTYSQSALTPQLIWDAFSKGMTFAKRL